MSAARNSPRSKHRYNTQNLSPPWQPGQSGNPSGRPRARGVVGIAFVEACYQDWLKSGQQSFRTAAKKDPLGYLRLVAEVGLVVGKQHSPGEHEPVDDNRPVLALGDLLAYITHGGPPPPVPDRPVRTFDSSPQPAGCDAPVDSRPLPGDPE